MVFMVANSLHSEICHLIIYWENDHSVNNQVLKNVTFALIEKKSKKGKRCGASGGRGGEINTVDQSV